MKYIYFPHSFLLDFDLALANCPSGASWPELDKSQLDHSMGLGLPYLAYRPLCQCRHFWL